MGRCGPVWFSGAKSEYWGVQREERPRGSHTWRHPRTWVFSFRANILQPLLRNPAFGDPTVPHSRFLGTLFLISGPRTPPETHCCFILHSWGSCCTEFGELGPLLSPSFPSLRDNLSPPRNRLPGIKPGAGKLISGPPRTAQERGIFQ